MTVSNGFLAYWNQSQGSIKEAFVYEIATGQLFSTEIVSILI